MLRSFTVVIILFTAFAIWTVYSPEQLEEPVNITIEKGETVDSIINSLESSGVIDSALFAKLYVKAKGIASNLQAGEYTFENTISLATVLNKLAAPRGPDNEITLTFIEGWTIDEMAEYIGTIEGIKVSESDFRKATQRSFDFSFIKALANSRDLEGYLFPDTYRVFEDITPDELVKKMLTNFDEKLNEEDIDAINSSGRSIDEVVILASILERELLTLEDRKRGAGVFLNRLDQGMGLQADSTVNYITKKKSARASFEDIKIDSPYNTYKYRGLPSGPISNPGEDSLEAAIYPESNPYFYFLTTPEGEAIFNTTLDGHNTSKAKYY